MLNSSRRVREEGGCQREEGGGARVVGVGEGRGVKDCFSFQFINFCNIL